MYPTSLRAYYTAGNVYMLQGRPDYAVKTYEIAIPHVVQQGNPPMIRLWKSFEAVALAQQKKHIDFLATVLFDLVSSILIHLSPLTLVECMTVSKTWFELVDGCQSAWNTITVGEDEYPGEMENRREYNIEIHVACTRSDGIRKLSLGPWLSSVNLRAWMIKCFFQFNYIRTLGKNIL